MMPQEKLLSHRKAVGNYFEVTADSWEEVYKRQGRFYQQRHERVLHLIDKLELSPGSRLLEIGSGPGLTSVALARRGYLVHAIDIAPAMIARTLRRAAAANVRERVWAEQADIQALTFKDQMFDLVLAVGVIPWVHSPQRALAEMLRVLKPGGFLIVTTDNIWALHHVLDPLLNPLVMPLKHTARRLLAPFVNRLQAPLNRLDSAWEVDRWLREAGFEKLKSSTLGFGPFSVFKWSLRPLNMAIRVGDFLQRLADSGTPILRSMGHIYIVLCQKPSSAPL